MSLCLSISIHRGRSRKTEPLLHLQVLFWFVGFFLLLGSPPQLKDSFITHTKASLNCTKLSADTHFNSQADTQFRVTQVQKLTSDPPLILQCLYKQSRGNCQPLLWFC